MLAATKRSRRLEKNSLPPAPWAAALSGDSVAPIVSAEGVLRHMAKSPSGGWPTEVFHYSRKYMYLNGEAIEVLHQPAAHTDSDVFAFFRRSDVVVAGDVLDTRQFPSSTSSAAGASRARSQRLIVWLIWPYLRCPS